MASEHTESDLRVFLAWCRQRGLQPMDAQRLQLELYVRWMQEVRRFQPRSGRTCRMPKLSRSYQ